MRHEDLPYFPAGGPGAAERAAIDPPGCIGCVRCLQACPVDAIIGARQRMHTVIAEWCTGCARCVAPCPTGCIRIEASNAAPDLALAFTRHEHREQRLARAAAARRAAGRSRGSPAPAPRREIIEAAVERARARLAQRTRNGAAK